MANTKQAIKRARQAEKHRANNRWQISQMQTSVKDVVKAIQANDLDQAKAKYQTATSVLDRMAAKGFIKENKAARHKSRLNQKIKAMAQA